MARSVRRRVNGRTRGVDQEEYLLGLIRYIHENPVKAGLAENPGRYCWSSHRLILRGAPRWLAPEEVLKRFGRSRAMAKRSFVAQLPLSRIARSMGKDPSTLWRDVARLEAKMAVDRQEQGRVRE